MLPIDEAVKKWREMLLRRTSETQGFVLDGKAVSREAFIDASVAQFRESRIAREKQRVSRMTVAQVNERQRAEAETAAPANKDDEISRLTAEIREQMEGRR